MQLDGRKLRTGKLPSHLLKDSKGIAQVMLEDLSPELQERFGYDPGAAEAYQKELDARNREAREARLKAIVKRT